MEPAFSTLSTDLGVKLPAERAGPRVVLRLTIYGNTRDANDRPAQYTLVAVVCGRVV
jgi:hypothetical protein